MKAYIFDLDGVLLDSLRLWEQIDEDFLAKRGFKTPPDYIDALSSQSFPEAARYTIRRFGLPDSADDLMREWNAMAAYAYGNTVPLKPSAREYLLALKERGAKLGVATGLPAELFVPALRRHGIMDLFDAVCSTDEVAHGKIRPDIFLLTAGRLGIPPAACIAFEDTLEAIKSARQAGMTVYGVYDEASKGDWPRIEAIADGVIFDFKDAPLPE